TYVAQFTPTLAQSAGSMRHLGDLFAEEPQVVDAPDAVPLPRLEKEIVFENISFSYPDGSFALRNIDVRIPKGSSIAFVGASGSGKSTLLNLLMRFYDLKQGAILIAGKDVRTVTQESLRAQIGMVFQDSYLFNTSIVDNTRM